MSFRRWYIVIFIVLSVVGVLDASYLSAKDILHKQVSCSIISGCEEVLTSKYAHLGVIPIAMFGVAYYLWMLIAASVYLDNLNNKIRKYIVWTTPIGLVASIGFVGLQIFVIHSICVYCLGSAFISTMLFLIAVFGFRRHIPPEAKRII